LPLICTRSSLELFSPSSKVQALADFLGCSPFVASLIEMRDPTLYLRTEEAREWLNPSLTALLEISDLSSRSETLLRFWKTMNSSKNIAVYGDYDVDGICSTVLAMELIMAKGARARYFIPHRHEQGYGLHEEVITRLLDSGSDGIIVVDCGSKDSEIINSVTRRGIGIAVYDHHLSEDMADDTVSWLVNPHITGDQHSKTLCATGVLWVWAYQNRIISEDWLRRRLDLVALATLADCMPLELLNRSMVIEGIECIRKKPRPGLKALIDMLGLSLETLNEEQLVMKVIPCLNAPGRMDIADITVNLLAGSHNSRLNADRIISFNKKRQETSRTTVDELMQKKDNERAHVFYDPQWHVGVLSGVASNLCNYSNKPIALAAPVKKGIRGTLRVPEGANAVKILNEISDFLSEWGGHEYAAGFAVENDRWEALQSVLEAKLSSVHIEPPRIRAMAFPPQKMDMAVYNQISRLSPFGNGNPRPLFYHDWKGSEEIRPLGKDGVHRKISINGNEILAFHSGEFFSSRTRVEGLIYYPRLDTWRGNTRLQLILEAFVIEK